MAESYLKQREETIQKEAPNWRWIHDGPPLCVPPSWDLVRNYVGPVPVRDQDQPKPDGFDRVKQFTNTLVFHVL